MSNRTVFTTPSFCAAEPSLGAYGPTRRDIAPENHRHRAVIATESDSPRRGLAGFGCGGWYRLRQLLRNALGVSHAIGHRDRAETTHEQPRGSRSASWNTSLSGDPEHNLRKSSATRAHSSPMIRLSVRPRTSWREDTMTCPLRACGTGLCRIMVALILAAWCSPAAAQQPAAPPQMNMADHRGAIRGVVRGDAGAPVQNATVTAVNADNGAQFTATTDAQGAYSFGALPVGKYNITIQSAGLTAFRRTGVEAAMDKTRNARHHAERGERGGRGGIGAAGTTRPHRVSRAAHQRPRIERRAVGTGDSCAACRGLRRSQR